MKSSFCQGKIFFDIQRGDFLFKIFLIFLPISGSLINHQHRYEMKPRSKKNNETGVWQGIIFEAVSLCLGPELLPQRVCRFIFLQIAKCICPKKMYLIKFQNVFVFEAVPLCLVPDLPSQVKPSERGCCFVFLQNAKCICPNYKLYLFKFQNVFV